MSWRKWLVVLMLIMAGAQTSAKPARDKPDCRDDRGVDRCDPAQHRRVLALFGMEPIERHAAAGDQVRRAFYVDGYGRDVVAIAFVRSPGRDPELRVHFKREGGDKPPPEPLRAPVPQKVWEELAARSELFDRDLVPLYPEDDGTISMCIHSWVFTVESVDAAPREGGTPEVRRKVEDACDDGLAAPFAREIQGAAVPLLPHCALLDPRQHRNEAALLRACGMLEGDRLAAAAVLNRSEAFRNVEGPKDASALLTIFEPSETVVDWNGETRTGPEAREFWASKIGEAGSSGFFVESVRGESARRVRLAGVLSRYRDVEGSEESVLEIARVEQIWTLSGREFFVSNVEVGPFAPFSVPED